MSSDYIVTVFITLITVVDPIGLIPIYLPIRQRFNAVKQKRIIWMSFTVALIVASLFLFFGKFIFSYLGISYEAVYIVGGTLLFLIGLDMIYARPRKSQHSEEDTQELLDADSVSVFPLAIPMLSGPGTLATVVMFSATSDSSLNTLLVFCATLTAFLLCVGAMFFSAHIYKYLGRTGLNAIERVIGILLCALAVQFIINAVMTLSKELIK